MKGVEYEVDVITLSSMTKQLQLWINKIAESNERS